MTRIWHFSLAGDDIKISLWCGLTVHWDPKAGQWYSPTPRAQFFFCFDCIEQRNASPIFLSFHCNLVLNRIVFSSIQPFEHRETNLI